MNRAAAQAYLESEYQPFASEASLDHTSASQTYATVIDQSLRQLQVLESDLPTAVIDPSQAVAYLALLDYYALSRYATIFALRTDITVAGAISAAQSQVFAHVQRLLDRAQERLVQIGVGPVKIMQMGRLELDFLEPDFIIGGQM